MPNEPSIQDENHVIAERRGKLKALRATGPAYPNDFQRVELAADLIEKYDGHDRDTLDLNPVQVQIAGRLMLRRTMGKLSFGDLQDMSGNIQIFVADNFPGKA
ncbi:MAG: lysine--tRNA ligase, partial [Betaproteobacteria bacterium]